MSDEAVVPKQRQCWTCGHTIEADVKECTFCKSVDYKRRCVVCGKNLEYGAKQCSNCKSYQSDLRCIACARILPDQAKHCNECKSYQDWRRYFGTSQTVLALFVALLSILMPLMKQIADYANRNSTTSIAFQSATDQEIAINAMNTGRARSVLRRYWLRSNDHGVLEDAELDLVSHDSKELTVVSGNEDLTVRLKPLTGLTAHVPYEEISEKLRKLEVTLVVEVQESNGRFERLDRCSALRIERFILTHVPQVAKGAPS